MEWEGPSPSDDVDSVVDEICRSLPEVITHAWAATSPKPLVRQHLGDD